MFGVGNPTFTNYFRVLGPRPGMLGVGNPFSEKMLKKHKFSHGLGAARHSEADEPDEADEAYEPDLPEMVHDRQFGP